MYLNQCVPFLQVSLADSECAVARQREQHGKAIASLQSKMEESRRSYWEEVERERRRCEEVRRELEKRLGELEEEGERVRVEVTTHYEEDARKMHHQHRTQVCGGVCLCWCYICVSCLLLGGTIGGWSSAQSVSAQDNSQRAGGGEVPSPSNSRGGTVICLVMCDGVMVVLYAALTVVLAED